MMQAIPANRHTGLIEYAESLEANYINEILINILRKSNDIDLLDLSKNVRDYLKAHGQFFTPKNTSKFMIKQFNLENKNDTIYLLDPGAGIGIFESSLCEHLIEQNLHDINIKLDLYENDENILPLLKDNISHCRDLMSQNDCVIQFNICERDFLLSNSAFFEEASNCLQNRYDFIICNPPYYKLKNDSPYKLKMTNIIRAQPNIYSLFMALCAKLLKEDGQIVLLTPRSYCSGTYFKLLRRQFFMEIVPTKIHLFHSRKKVFNNVIQEVMILTGVKSSKIPEQITVSSSNGELMDGNYEFRNVDYSKIVIKKGNEVFIRVPVSELDDEIAAKIDGLSFDLSKLGLGVSTGKVVPDRCDYLIRNLDNRDSYAPLLWMKNITNGSVRWPVDMGTKSIAVSVKQSSLKLLLLNNNYVLVKRFSSKEGKRRLNAGALFRDTIDSYYIAIENHVNYIYRSDGELTKYEVNGITALLNSRIYNIYFQIMNGSTQVNASELLELPLPSIEKIRSIGKFAEENRIDNFIEIEKYIGKELDVDGNLLETILMRYQKPLHHFKT